MKKITTVVVLILLAAVTVSAQEFKKFRVGLGTGYAIPSGDGAKGGVLFYFEPGYRVNDQLLINLRMEFAAMARGIADADGADFDVNTSGSYTLNGQYYFSNEGFRPFVGAGFGMYNCKGASTSFDDGSGGSVSFGLADETKFGFYPRVGFDAGHFQLSIDYNIVGATKEEYSDPDFGTFEFEQKNTYIGIRLGAYIGGGRQ